MKTKNLPDTDRSFESTPVLAANGYHHGLMV
jgi:hypothetical protein